MKKCYIPLIAAGLIVVSAPAARAEWGDLTGQFVYDGPAPARPAVQITKDLEFCGKHDLKEDTLVVDPESGGIADVIVLLINSEGVKAHPSYDESANDDVVLDNENCRYEPHIVLLRTTQTLVIGNKDPVGHNTNISVINNPAMNVIIPGNGSVKVKFTGEERFPVPVGCNIHPWMTARLVVKEHPYMAVTDKDGRFTLRNLPEGQWTFHAWHERSGHVVNVNLDDRATTWARGRFDHTINSGDNDLGVIKVAPTNFK